MVRGALRALLNIRSKDIEIFESGRGYKIACLAVVYLISCQAAYVPMSFAKGSRMQSRFSVVCAKYWRV